MTLMNIYFFFMGMVAAVFTIAAVFFAIGFYYVGKENKRGREERRRLDALEHREWERDHPIAADKWKDRGRQ